MEPQSFEQYITDAVDRFAERMKQTLLKPKNFNKGDWTGVPLHILSAKLTEERQELYEAITLLYSENNGDPTSDRAMAVLNEAADLACVTMMLADASIWDCGQRSRRSRT